MRQRGAGQSRFSFPPSYLLLAWLTLRFARQPALGPGGPLNTSADLAIRSPTAGAGYDYSILRWWLSSFRIGILDLRIDGAAIDGAAALFALHNPIRRQRKLPYLATHHRRIHGESNPQPMRDQETEARENAPFPQHRCPRKRAKIDPSARDPAFWCSPRTRRLPSIRRCKCRVHRRCCIVRLDTPDAPPKATGARGKISCRRCMVYVKHRT